jgi:hypothetical protein
MKIIFNHQTHTHTHTHTHKHTLELLGLLRTDLCLRDRGPPRREDWCPWQDQGYME